MAKFRSIQTSFWSDSKIVDDFTPEDRYFYLYLLTNEKSNQLGCYELSIKQMCRDTGYNEETVKKLLDRFENVLEVINFDYKTKEIFIKKWYKYNWLNSNTTRTCIEKEFNTVKSLILKDLIYPMYGAYIPHGSNKKKKKKKKKNKKNNSECVDNKLHSREENFVANAPTPTLFEIVSYGGELELSEEYCEKFYNHYEAIGWVNGSGNEIKNWKLVLRNWKKKDIEKGNIKDKNKIDTDRICEDENGKLYKMNYDGTRYYI